MGRIVDPGSADAGLPGVVPIPIEADHIEICKPADKGALLYSRTRDFLTANIGKGERPAESGDAGLETPSLPPVSRSKPNTWIPITLRLAVLVLVAVIGL